MTQLAVPPTPAAPVPAPVIPFTDPSAGTTPTISPAQQLSEAQTAEAQAQQLTTASLSTYGSLPNPQMAFEAITTGATPTISSMIQAGNPLFQAELAGAPAGSAATGSPYPQVPSQINDPMQSLWQWNPQQHARDLKNQFSPSYLGNSQNSSWKSFGDAPQMNFGWMQAQQQGGPALTKKWQNLLKTKGFFAQSNYQVSGVWDQQTEAAFQGFMIQWATPYALFSQDATTKGNANEFLTGLGMDTATLETSIGRDPSTLAQVAQGWMAAQGPDAGGDQKSELQQYADTFGMASLPDSYQAILHTDPISAIRNGIASILPLGGLPVIGGAYNALLNVATGNVGAELSGMSPITSIFQDPRQQREQQIQQEMTTQDKLSQADVANLQPALKAVADDAGFMGFMSTYDNIRTTTILTVWDTLKEAFTTGKLENPFDPLSTPRVEAAAADNNLAAGIFGQGWATDNPGWASLFNAAINIADDPTSYVSLIGKIEGIQRMNGIRTVSRVIGSDGAREAFTQVAADGMKVGANQGMFNAARTAYQNFKGGKATGAIGTFKNTAGATKQAEGIYGLTDIASMYGVTGAGGERDLAAMQLLQKAMEEPDQHKAWDLMENGDESHLGFGWKVQSGKGVFNARANWKALSQVKSQTTLGKMRVVGGFNTSAQWNALTDPAGTSSFLRNMSIVAEMDPAEISPALEKYLNAALKDPDKAVLAANDATELIKKAYLKLPGVDEAAFTKWMGDAEAHVVAYAPQAETGAEQSYVLSDTAGLSDAQKANAQSQLNAATTSLKHLQGTGASPEMIKAAQDEINRIARPAPALTTQMGNEFVFPWSPFDMVVYKNPAFRKSVKLQRQAGLDKVMNSWRRITIARISSAMRMDIGDDMIRPFTQLMFGGHPYAASQYLTGSILRMFGLLTPKVRGRVQQGMDSFLEENPQAGRLLQTMHKTLQEGDTNSHRPIAPGDVGYQAALSHQMRNHWRVDPMSQAWLQATPGKEKQAVSDLFKQAMATPDATPELAKVNAYIRARNGHLAPEFMQALTDQFHEMMGGYMANPVIRRMATKGVNERDLKNLVRDQANTPHRLPIVVERQSTPFSDNNLTQMVNKLPNAVFENITGPMINTARGRGFMYMKSQFEETMKKHFEGQPRYGTPEFMRQIDQESTAQAIDWIVNNTYQGTRSVAGSTMRNIFPFYGATSNMDRFFLRQTMAHPFVGSIVAHTAQQTSISQNPQNVNSPGLTGLQGVLAHMGFGAGEGIQFNPLHAFFLTSDGIGSMVPGTGPIFAPLWNAASAAGNGNLSQILADLVPGAAEQIDFNTGQAKPQFSWLADLLSGTSMAVTGQNLPGDVPGLDLLAAKSNASVNAQVEAAVQQYERANPGVRVDSSNPSYDRIMQGIRQQVGLDEMLQGAASYVAPVSPVVENVQQQDTAANLDLWRQQPTSAARDQVMLQFLPGVTEQQWQAALTMQPGAPSVAQLIAKAPTSDAALMAYLDSRVNQSDRDAIANAKASQWVVSASQSKYQTATLGVNQPDRPFDLPQWQLMRNLGDITNLTPDQFTGAVYNERDINTGWLEYDNLKNQEYVALVQNGWTTSSPQYTAWNQAVFQPQLAGIEQNHPAFAQMFGSGGGTTAADLSMKTRALRTLQTWEVLPQHSDFENSQTVLWRNALQLMDNAAGQIYALKAGGGSSAEQQMVMATFQGQLQGLAQQDPTFAAMLGGFRFSSWEDIVNLSADEMQANQLAGYPAQVGPMGQG